jgi:hypothetical protein
MQPRFSRLLPALFIVSLLAAFAAAPSRADTTVWDYKYKGFSLWGEVYTWTVDTYSWAHMDAYEQVLGPGKPAPFCLGYAYGSQWSPNGYIWWYAWGEIPASGWQPSSKQLDEPASCTATFTGYIESVDWSTGYYTYFPATFYAQVALDAPADVWTERGHSSYTSVYPDGSMWKSMGRWTGRTGYPTGILSLLAITEDGTLYTFADGAATSLAGMRQATSGSLTITKVSR